MPRNIVALLDNENGRKMILQSCKDRNLIFAEFEALVQAEVEKAGMQRRRQLWNDFDDILDRILVEEQD